jgi:putative transposase
MRVITFKSGETILWNQQEYIFEAAVDENTLLARNTTNGRKEILPLIEISSPFTDKNGEKTELSQISSKEWQEAKRRHNAIKPILNLKYGSKAYIEAAKSSGIHPATLYRWKKKFLKTGLLSSLLNQKPGSKAGKIRLNLEVEDVLKNVIHEIYLNTQKASPVKVHEEVTLRCKALKYEIPHLNTIRNRIRNLSAFEKERFREGYKEAEQKWSPNEGSLNAPFPLSIVQIDHTPLDIVLVDDESRMPIGRPWITIAFDVCTRIILGFYVSFDPPGTLSVGLCLSRAFLRKEAWLLKLGVQVEWPCWGLPHSIHADNAKEFRGEALTRACEQYGMDLHWRPVARPNWGGHIERYMLTLSQELQSLPGATFKNPTERGNYDSEGKAALTIRELERYLVLFICGNYHLKKHTAINQSPLEAWKEGLFGGHKKIALGLPRMVSDEERMKIDFMPIKERSIREYGVRLDGIHYFSDVLRPYVNSVLPGKGSLPRQFLFRRDPRDISFIYFWDEDNGQYHPISYRDTSRPSISYWELQAARRHLKERGEKLDNEDSIFTAISEMRALVQTSVRATKKKRREIQREKMHQEAKPKLLSPPFKKSSSKSEEQEEDDSLKFTAFEDIRVQT